jgi:hypothetical protein
MKEPIGISMIEGEIVTFIIAFLWKAYDWSNTYEGLVEDKSKT